MKYALEAERWGCNTLCVYGDFQAWAVSYRGVIEASIAYYVTASSHFDDLIGVFLGFRTTRAGCCTWLGASRSGQIYAFLRTASCIEASRVPPNFDTIIVM
jgi:hypothetical protein